MIMGRSLRPTSHETSDAYALLNDGRVICIWTKRQLLQFYINIVYVCIPVMQYCIMASWCARSFTVRHKPRTCGNLTCVAVSRSVVDIS